MILRRLKFRFPSSLNTPLITAFVSAAVALFIFAATQVILHLKERQSLLSEKLEELFILLVEMQQRNADRFPMLRAKGLNMLVKRELNIQEFFATDLEQKIKVLVRLYFPQIDNEYEAFSDANRKTWPLYNMALPGPLDPDGDEMASATSILSEASDAISAMASTLLLRREELTKSPIRSLVHLWDKLTY